MFGIQVRIRRESGPFFDNRVHRAFDDFSDDLEDEAAEWALSDIRRTFHTSFKAPTGYYESHVRISNIQGDPVVNDGGRISYGPWLEGVGSRNAPVTRFKGYRAFRNAADRLQVRIAHMGERMLVTGGYLNRMS